MRIIRSDKGQRILFLGVLLILAAWAVGAHALPPDRTTRFGERVAQAAPPAKTGVSLQEPEKKIAFEMRDKPWIGEKGSVLEWLGDQSGMPVSTSSAKPTGTLTYINPVITVHPSRDH